MFTFVLIRQISLVSFPRCSATVKLLKVFLVYCSAVLSFGTCDKVWTPCSKVQQLSFRFSQVNVYFYNTLKKHNSWLKSSIYLLVCTKCKKAEERVRAPGSLWLLSQIKAELKRLSEIRRNEIKTETVSCVIRFIFLKIITRKCLIYPRMKVNVFVDQISKRWFSSVSLIIQFVQLMGGSHLVWFTATCWWGVQHWTGTTFKSAWKIKNDFSQLLQGEIFTLTYLSFVF